MTKEEKDLLLRYLCTMLPYGVICEYTSIQPGYELYNEIGVLKSIQKDYQSYKFVIDGHLCGFSDFKPYLRPLSSMTKDEEKEFEKIFELELRAIEAPEGHTIVSAASSTFEIDFYNKHHFDYRGLIERGLAIAVTEENNPYKE